MSLYNLVFGFNPLAQTLMAMLDLLPGEVGRFRDCFLDDHDGELCIAVYTRNGGGNREHYPENPETEAGERCGCTGCTIEYRLPRHALYIADRDDELAKSKALRDLLPKEEADESPEGVLDELILERAAEHDDPPDLVQVPACLAEEYRPKTTERLTGKGRAK